MRIIAGKHKGRKVEILRQATHVRPTSEFARQAIFNILSHGVYASDETSPFRGKPVADLCCGSGAFGLEALSRGASHVTFIDMDHHALLSARQNAERFGEIDNVSFVRSNVSELPTARQPYGLLFLDPPYFSNLIAPCMKGLMERGWMNEHSLLVIEHDGRETPQLPERFVAVDERRYGRAILRLLRLEKESKAA